MRTGCLAINKSAGTPPQPRCAVRKDISPAPSQSTLVPGGPGGRGVAGREGLWEESREELVCGNLAWLGGAARGSSHLALLGADKGDQPPPSAPSKSPGTVTCCAPNGSPRPASPAPWLPQASPVASAASRQGRILGGSGLGSAGCLLCFLKLPSLSFFCFLPAASS